MTTKLYCMKELADLFVDACIRDAEGKMVFLSVYGRDGSVLQMLAALSENVTAGGLRQFTLVDPDGEDQEHVVGIGDVDRLKKYTGKLPKAMLFASMVHAWLYDPVIVRPDRSNQVGWVLSDASMAFSLDDPVWLMVKLLSSVPLLDHWREPVLQGMPDLVTDLSQSLYPPIGRVAASKVALPKSFPEFISNKVKDGTLLLTEPDMRIAA